MKKKICYLGMILFSYLTDFVGRKSEHCRVLCELVKNGGLERGRVDGFSYFQLFYLLTRILPV
jgi:hypothetical protein